MQGLITEKQVNFIKKLAHERGVEDEAFVFLNAGPDKASASAYIGSLLERPLARPDAPIQGIDLRSVPTGRYAAEDKEGVLRFFKIDNVQKGRWEGWVFVKAMASNDLWKVGSQRPNQAYSGKSMHAMSLIAENPEAASARYGQEIGVCGVCGRTLTDPDSIRRGIGPVCAERF